MEKWLVEYTGSELNYENHDMDNSILMCQNLNEYEMWFRQYGCVFLGFSLHYTYRPNPTNEIALVYKDENDNIMWIHKGITGLDTFISYPYSFEEKVRIVNEFLDSIGYKDGEDANPFVKSMREMK